MNSIDFQQCFVRTYIVNNMLQRGANEKYTCFDHVAEEIRKAKEQLAEAQKVVDDVMAQGGTVLDQYAVPYSDLTMGASLGEGSFGTVYQAKLKRGAGEITVAVKTMRVEKVTTEIMDKFRGEICVSRSMHTARTHSTAAVFHSTELS